MSEAAAEAARRGRYSRVPTSEAKDEGGGGGSSGFKVGYYVVFCFRQPDDRTQRNLLNTLATMTSFYIHCEVCVLNEEMTETRTLYITNQSEVVTFAHVDYARKDAPVPWVFVWCRLTEVQRNKMAAALLHSPATTRSTFPRRASTFSIASRAAATARRRRAARRR